MALMEAAARECLDLARTLEAPTGRLECLALSKAMQGQVLRSICGWHGP